MDVQWSERGWRRNVEGARRAQVLRESLGYAHSSALRELVLPDERSVCGDLRRGRGAHRMIH